MGNGLFSKIIQGILIGGGTVLSLVVPGGSVIGVPLITAGASIGAQGSTQSAGSMNLSALYGSSTGAQPGQNILSTTIFGISLPVLAIMGALAYLIFKKKKR